MKHNMCYGWTQVFCFSFKEGFKQKSYRLCLICLSVILLLSVPIMGIIQGDNSVEEEAVSEISKVIIYDETDLNIDFEKALTDKRYTNTTLVTAPKISYAEQVKKLEEGEESTEIVIRIGYDVQGNFNINMVKSVQAPLSQTDLENFTEDFMAYFNKARLYAVDLNETQLKTIEEEIETSVKSISETGQIIALDEQNQGITSIQYTVMLIGLMLVTFMISFSSNNIASAIVTEKSNKIVEYLMIHVKSIDLLVGKILANILLVFVQFICYFISFVVSFLLNQLVRGEQEALIDHTLTEILACVQGVSPFNVFVAVIVIIVSVLFYSILGAIAGASVSKIEEMAEGMKLLQIVMVLGAYLGIALCVAEMVGGANEVFKTICLLLPISAPFIVPAFLILGKISVLMGSVSFLLMVVATVILGLFTAKIYEVMILYQGKTLKLKDMIKIAQNKPLVEMEEA